MKILALTERLPYAPDRGHRIRPYHVLRRLARDAELHLFSFADDEELGHTTAIREWLVSLNVATPSMLVNKMKGAMTLAGTRPLTHSLLDAPGVSAQLAALAEQIAPDVLFAHGSGMARFAVDGPLQHLPCVLDLADVESEKWSARSATTAAPLGWIYRREARVLRTFEARAARRAAVTLVMNERERELLASLAPDARIEVVGNGVDLEFFRPPGTPRPSQDVMFCGALDDAQNIEGVEWFAGEIWPAVHAAVPTARFRIIGAEPTSQILELSKVPGVQPVGPVHDVRPYLWDAALSIAPLRTAHGIQNKVLEALAAGLPVATTPAVAEGLPREVLDACAVTDDASLFGQAVVEMLREPPDVRRRIAAAAQLTDLTWERRLDSLSGFLSEASNTRITSTP